ncbi:hypothetical protein M406DRAFT_335948 [Cryphonectria parasitica EP155]|uniref:Rhodanese domain-containing protein n=1 Tax=Cryphonectria parasitica (strain ATCC 38755 / EP155) TaxID=660469 RepID=A0A9P5CT32_CRYP1|nr:uncharacterized protein M406DRAFT_335948 [Cryphonectria parasitica EP155]KAF3770239.1 hypothetical protein M406DRAFT_335948 [Cryphonectria parasitica EP155]
MRPEEYGSGIDYAPPATHDTSRVNYHVKQLDSFAQTLQESASRAFPNRGRASQRYRNVQVLLLHWKTDDLFVLPELEDLDACLREDYGFNTDVFAIPADNPHLDLMMRIGSLIKDHEHEDTLFIIYYGGHAKIDESRQSTWCATRHSGSPSLQWSAIQTLLERSVSDVLVLLDCCAGAASATFPNGKSITETISASSWDAIAPDPGRYSFTNALIEVLGEWRLKTFSAAMLHAEILARLKHPRPILINGKRFEARSTPVHFMMTSDHRAPSIEMSRMISHERVPPSPPQDPSPSGLPLGRGPAEDEECCTEPNEDKPHVMISLALEDDQRLDLNAWEQWLAGFPALAKYVKVQGVFKSHSTLLLLSMPVGVWDLLPEDQACSFVAFIRSNNLVKNPERAETPFQNPADVYQSDRSSVFSAGDRAGLWRAQTASVALQEEQIEPETTVATSASQDRTSAPSSARVSTSSSQRPPLQQSRTTPPYRTGGLAATMALAGATLEGGILRQPLMNHSRNSKRTVFASEKGIPPSPRLATHVVSRLEEYFRVDPHPSDGTAEYYASHLGIEANEVKILFADLRSPSEFQRSHVHSAVNLRMPAKFLRIAALEMLDRTFPDEQSRRSFTRWSKTKCVVIYDRNIEALWECPAAVELLELLRREGWPGNCFVLKGPFREFSMSFDKYITGDRMTKEAKKYADSLRSATPPTEDQVRRNQVRYEEWLQRVQHESNTQHSYFSPREVGQKKAVVDEHQRELEAEFKGRFPDLYQMIKDMSVSMPPAPPAPPPKHGKGAYYDNDSYFENRKAHLVGNLSTGLDKMREAAGERLPDKLGELPALEVEEFDEIDPREAQQSPHSPGAGRSAAPPASEAGSGGSGNAPPISPLEYAARRLARENAAQKQGGLWKRLKGTNGK